MEHTNWTTRRVFNNRPSQALATEGVPVMGADITRLNAAEKRFSDMIRRPSKQEPLHINFAERDHARQELKSHLKDIIGSDDARAEMLVASWEQSLENKVKEKELHAAELQPGARGRG